MRTKQQTLDFFDEIVPIPECSELLEMSRLKTPQQLANEMAREAKQWQEKHPDRNVMKIITPDWREYIRSRL